jgi:YihY family inner membrane protein
MASRTTPKARSGGADPGAGDPEPAEDGPPARVEPTSRRVVDAVDHYQRRHRWVGFPLAVIYKYADDQGGYLAALITYYGFLSIFPLLLLLLTILSFVLQGDPGLQSHLVNSAVAQFPVVGDALRNQVRPKGSSAGLVIGIVGTLYGSIGAAQATQHAFNKVWAVPRNERPNPIKSRLRSLILLGGLGLGVIVTTIASGISSGAGSYGATVGTGVRIATILVVALANIGLFLFAFRVLTAHEIPTRCLRLGAVIAGLGWEALQYGGTYYVSQLKGSSAAYGVFGAVLGLVAWIYLLAVMTVVAAEISVVSQRHLWPRALLTPFTDDVSLTHADERSYTFYAESERHKGFENVDVDFAGPPAPPPPAASEPERPD